MNRLSPDTRQWLALQGFERTAEPAFEVVAPWLRLAPALCAMWNLVALVLGAGVMFLALVPLAAVCLAFGRHPFDWLYQYGVRSVFGGPRLPRYGVPRRFACALALPWLSAVWMAFDAGMPEVGYALGTGMVAVQILAATTDVCLPCLLFTRVTAVRRSEGAAG